MRVSEWLVIAFFSWTSLLAVVLPIPGDMRDRTLFTNAVIFAAMAVVFLMRRFPWMNYARDWIPQVLLIVAYKEMGWFAPATHTYQLENKWIVWDRLLLDTWDGRSIVEFLGPIVPSLLEASYVLVYAVPPITMGILYGLGLQKRADTMLTIYLLGMFLCYGQFPFWPSEPPRSVFPGEDMPNVYNAVRKFSLWVVGNYGIHTSVFPSAHVAGAFAASWAMKYLAPERRGLVAGYFIYALMVATATVYGRYHYAVDAVAGTAIGSIALPLGLWLLERRRS